MGKGGVGVFYGHGSRGDAGREGGLEHSGGGGLGKGGVGMGGEGSTFGALGVN